jgi:hypothetical protein
MLLILSEDPAGDPLRLQLEDGTNMPSKEHQWNLFVSQIDSFIERCKIKGCTELDDIIFLKGKVVLSKEAVFDDILQGVSVEAIRWSPEIKTESLMRKSSSASSIRNRKTLASDGRVPCLTLEQAREGVTRVVRLFTARYNSETPDNLENCNCIIPLKDRGRDRTNLEIFVQIECTQKISNEIRHIASISKAKEAYLSKLAREYRCFMNKKSRPAECLAKECSIWYTTVGRHLVAVFKARGKTSGIPGPCINKMNEILELYPRNWFDPHIDLQLQQHIHEENMNSGCENILSKTGTYDRNEITTQRENSLVCENLRAQYDEKIENLERENARKTYLLEGQLQCTRQAMEANRRNAEQIKAKDAIITALQKESTRWHQSGVQRKKQKTSRYPTLHAVTDCPVEARPVLQPIVSKSGRQIKISRRAQGIDDD